MSLLDQYYALRRNAGVLDRSDRGRLLLTGADRRSYLQGLLSNDIAALVPGSGCYAAYLTAQGRMSRWIVSFLPLALVLLITLINPHYMHPLLTRLAGKIMIVLAVLLVIGGSLVIKKIVDIKV